MRSGRIARKQPRPAHEKHAPHGAGERDRGSEPVSVPLYLRTGMLKEISANREHWLMRCVETLAPDEHGNTDTPENRMRAATLLDEFERQIRWLGKSGNYYLYNVNYSMRGAASEWIDGYRALAALASKRGDIDAQRKAEEKIDEILVMRGTWRPLMLIVRERAKDSKSTGWRNLLRWQRTATVDGQRTATQFPPA
jgi:hypothetical protein